MEVFPLSYKKSRGRQSRVFCRELELWKCAAWGRDPATAETEREWGGIFSPCSLLTPWSASVFYCWYLGVTKPNGKGAGQKLPIGISF